MMAFGGLIRTRTSPPLAVQIMLLLVGGLVVAQMVTLALTMLLPPRPPQQYRLQDIAEAIKGQENQGPGRRPLVRTVRAQPPSLQSSGWMVSERSRKDLAELLGADEKNVRLLFYSQLPFQGAGGLAEMGLGGSSAGRLSAPQGPPMDDGGTIERAGLRVASGPSDRGPFGGGGVRLPGGPGLGGFGGFPTGGAFPGSAAPPPMGVRVPPSLGPKPVYSPPPTSTVTASGAASASNTTSAATGGSASTASSGAAGASTSGGPLVYQGGGQLSNGPLGYGFGYGSGQPQVGVVPLMGGGFLGGGLSVNSPPAASLSVLGTFPSLIYGETPRPADSKAEPRTETSGFKTPTVIPNVLGAQSLAPKIAAPAAPILDHAVDGVIAPAALMAARTGDTAGWIVSSPELQKAGLFGIGPSPFVQSDFVAAVEAAPGRWITVQPKPEPFPNFWQRRVMLWFLLAFAIVGPLGWLFARSLAKPLGEFAAAAERLGRDPSGAVAKLAGPAEIGRAAHAFNAMQTRLKRFVDDRTAMVGAISHDLRTPLARMRFRMERAPESLKAGMLNDIGQMEEMISSVLVFIRDATEPSLRERVDLRSILECVVDDAALVGGDAVLELGDPLSVEVDTLGVQRVLTNLVDNALKYGRRAEVRMYAEGGDAVAEISDDGPGLPPEELERVFLPFYRSEAARTMNKGGIGLGLSVSRSIARAHGGDIRLLSEGVGVKAQLRLPLALKAA